MGAAPTSTSELALPDADRPTLRDISTPGHAAIGRNACCTAIDAITLADAFTVARETSNTTGGGQLPVESARNDAVKLGIGATGEDNDTGSVFVMSALHAAVAKSRWMTSTYPESAASDAPRFDAMCESGYHHGFGSTSIVAFGTVEGRQHVESGTVSGPAAPRAASLARTTRGHGRGIPANTDASATEGNAGIGENCDTSVVQPLVATVTLLRACATGGATSTPPLGSRRA